MDQETERRVWQRVQGRTEEALGAEGALMDALTDAAAFRHWAGRAGVPALRRLWERTLREAATLRGLCHLEERTAPRAAPAWEGQDAFSALRRCLGRMLRREQLYRTLAREELGPVYAALARESQEACLLLCQALGSLPVDNGGKP